METKRVLITGANGFIGSNLARYLLDCGYEIYISIRRSSNLWRLNDIIPEIETHYLIESSFQEFSYLLESVKPDILINTIGVDQWSNREDESFTWFGNFTILVNIARAMRNATNIFLIQSGSAFEYGRASIEHNPLNEEIICDPVSEYGASKLFASEYLKYLGKSKNTSSVVLRIFNAYGQYDVMNRLVPELIIKSLSKSRIILKNPTASRDFVHISDVTEIFRATIVNEDHLKNRHHIINVGTGVSHSVEEIAKYVGSITGNSLAVEIEKSDQRPENKIPGPVADINKARSILGWMPKLTINEGLKITTEWFRELRNLYQKF